MLENGVIFLLVCLHLADLAFRAQMRIKYLILAVVI